MAISKDEVKKLALLSRIALSEAELEKMQSEITAILSYIETIEQVPLAGEGSDSPHLALRNVMRDDTDAHEPGVFSEALLSQAPRREGDLVKVKKILG